MRRTSTEIYQEGLRIPPLKLYDRGVLNETLATLIKINVRVPDRVWGDLSAQYAAAQVGKRGLEKLFARYGAGEVEAYMAELLDYAERLTRAEIKTWPQGHATPSPTTSTATGSPMRRSRSKPAITVRDDGTLLVDYTGSSPQVKGALNSTLSFTHSLTYLSVRCVLPKDVPNNVGVFRCIEIKVPEASVLNPVMPGPCAARALTGYRVFDTMLGALSQIVPERVPAAGEGGNSVICISGLRPNRKPFIIVDMICGAWGGRPDKDGLEAVTNASQNLSNMPVEVMEAEHPGARGGVRLRAGHLRGRQMAWRRGTSALLPHPGARGAAADAHRPRGVRALRARRRRAGRPFAQLHRDRQPARAAAGQGDDDRAAGRGDHPRAGRRRRLRRSPRRDPALVREDILDGKISEDFARRHYGVSLDEAG